MRRIEVYMSCPQQRGKSSKDVVDVQAGTLNIASHRPLTTPDTLMYLAETKPQREHFMFLFCSAFPMQ